MGILLTQKLDIIENKIYCKDEKKKKLMIAKYYQSYDYILHLIDKLYGEVTNE